MYTGAYYQNIKYRLTIIGDGLCLTYETLRDLCFKNWEIWDTKSALVGRQIQPPTRWFEVDA